MDGVVAAVGGAVGIEGAGGLGRDARAHGGRVLDGGLGGEQAHDAFAGGLRALHFGELLRELVDGVEELAGEVDEGDQRAEGERRIQGQDTAAPEREAGGEAADRRDDGVVDRVLPGVIDGGVEHVGGEVLELGEVFLFAHEGLGGAHALDGLVEGGGDLRVVAAHLAGGEEHAALEKFRDDGERRHDREDDEAEAPVHPEEAGGDHDEVGAAPDDIEKAPGDDAGEAVAVASQARDEPADGAGVVEGEFEGLEFGEAVAADVVGEAVGDVAGALDEHPHADAEQQGGGEVGGDVAGEIGGGAVAHHAVDGPAGDEGEGGVAGGDDDRAEGERHEVALHAEGALKELPPEAGIEAGLELVFLLVGGGGHGRERGGMRAAGGEG